MTNTFLQTALLRAKSRSKNKKQNGFTLIELMVVVAIVGVLTAVGLPQLNAAQDKAKIAAAKQMLSNKAKECSIEIITDGTVPTFADDPAENIVGGECKGGAILSSVAADTAPTTLQLTLSADGIPGEIE
jgi:type IV pilus assembly protein PilA